MDKGDTRLWRQQAGCNIESMPCRLKAVQLDFQVYQTRGGIARKETEPQDKVDTMLSKTQYIAKEVVGEPWNCLHDAK